MTPNAILLLVPKCFCPGILGSSWRARRNLTSQRLFYLLTVDHLRAFRKLARASRAGTSGARRVACELRGNASDLEIEFTTDQSIGVWKNILADLLHDKAESLHNINIELLVDG